MRRIFLFFISYASTTGYVKAQENHSICEKLFYAVQSSGNDFSYARGTLKDESPDASDNNVPFRYFNYNLKPEFLANSDFMEGSISIQYDKRPTTKKPVKKSELKISTASLGVIKGGGRDSALVNRFLSMGGAVGNCFTGGKVEQAQLDDIEKFTKFIKYVLYTKNVLNERKLVEDSLCINNPYIEISLNKLTDLKNSSYEAYFAIRIIHITDL